MAVTYYDRFDPVEKRWDRILFIPGRGLQSAELNELQSIQDWKLKKLSDVFISDGSVIQGCAIVSPSSFPGELTIQEGYIYVNGKIIWTDEQTVTGDFQGVDIERIYLSVEETIITEVEDTDLHDPAIEEPNFGLPGAHRRVLTLSFQSEAEKLDTSIRWDFVLDGRQLFKRATFGGDKIIAAVEERTYEKHGNFLVNGADLNIQAVEDNDEVYTISVSPYNVYLKGRRYVAQINQINEVSKPISTFEDQDILAISQASGSVNNLTNNVFPLLGSYVKEVSTVTYPIRETLAVTHSGPGSTDTLNINGSIAQVQSIVQGDTLFELDVDYVVDYSNRAIDWSYPPPATEPVSDTSYFVTVVWYKTIDLNELTENSPEYQVNFPDASTGDYRDAELQINDTAYYGDTVTNFVNPEYLRFKRRIDAVVIDQATGIVETRLGEEVEFLPVPFPPVRDTDFLLYIIYTNPGDNYEPVSYLTDDLRVVRITQRGLNVMKRQLRTVQSNLSLAQLDIDAASMPVPGVLNGIFADTFETRDKSDTFYLGGIHTDDSETDLLPNPFYAGFDDGMLSSAIVIDDQNQSPTVLTSSLRNQSTVYTLPISSEEVVIEQPLANTWLSVQPYAFPKGRPKIEIDPANDMWTDNKTIEIITKTEEKIIRETVEVDRISGSGVTREVVSEELELIGVATENTIVKYARPITINIDGSGWFVQGDVANYSLNGTMAGVEIPEIANMTLTTAGTFSGSFVIPEAKVPSGNAPVEVVTEPYFLQASTNFFSHGIITTTTKSYKKIITIKETTQVIVEEEECTDCGGVDGQCALRLATAWRTGSKTAKAKVRWWARGADSIKIWIEYRKTNPDRVIHPYSVKKNKSGLDSGDSFAWKSRWRDVKNEFPNSNYGTHTFDLLWEHYSRVKLEAFNGGTLVCSKIISVSGHEFLADWADPLAQSFRTEEEYFLTGVGVYFQVKGQDPVECYIAEMVNGYPSRSYLGQSFIDASVVNVSDDSSAETVFYFDDVVHLEADTEYAIILKSSDLAYTAFVADQDFEGNDFLTNQPIITQAYDGVLFASPNQSTWEAKPSADLKFKLYRARFVSSGELTMQTQNLGNPSATPPTGYSWLKMLADYIEPGDSDLFMKYKVAGADFERIQVGEKKKLTTEGLSGQCQVKFELSTNNDLVTPVLNKQIGTLYWKYGKHCWWYSANIDFGTGNEFDKVKIRTYYINRNVSFKVYIVASTNGAENSWHLFDSDTHVEEESTEVVDVNIGTELKEYTFNLQSQFSFPQLARFARFVVEIGSDTYDGNDSPRFYDFRAVAFEEIA